MKLPAFEYACPTTLAEAVALLAARDGDAKALAGGQSLVPMMAVRLAAPALLVDLRKLSQLRQIRITNEGVALRAHAPSTHIEDDAQPRTAHRLLLAAVAHVAHYQIRNRGTVGGSIAHADPAAEMPGIAVTCEAQITAVGKAGSRVIRAADFFLGALTTALAPDEIITEIRLPLWPKGRRYGFQEFARPRGDFAMAGRARRCSTIRTRAARRRTRTWASSALAISRTGFRRSKRSSTAAQSTRRPSPRQRPPRPPKLSRRRTSTPAPPIAAPWSAPWSS